MRWAPFFLGFLTLAVACVVEGKPVIPDGSVEAGECGLCPANKPACLDNVECVECTSDEDDYCTTQSQVCDVENSECVDCVSDSDCTAPDASVCNLDSNECEPCESNAQCNDVDGLPPMKNACDDGECVDCTPETEVETCSNNTACNPATRECTDTEVGSLDVCEACVADSECGDEGSPSEAYRCVPLTWDGERFPDASTGFCLKNPTLGGSCSNPYRIVVTRPSLSGADPDEYCGINEELTICPAVRALLADTECDPTNGDDDCPQPPAGFTQPVGLCRELPGMVNRCTYRCSDIVECKSAPAPGSTCGSSGSGGGDYCGG